MMDVHEVKRSSASLGEETTPDIVVLRTASGEEARFALPLDESLVKNWSGLSELWFEDTAQTAVPRILGYQELRPNNTYLLKGREAKTATPTAIEIHHKVIDDGISLGGTPNVLLSTTPGMQGSPTTGRSHFFVPDPFAAAPKQESSNPIAIPKPGDSSTAKRTPVAAAFNRSLSVSIGTPPSQPLSGPVRPPLKIIVVGDAFTGKTTFIKKFCKGQVEKNVEYKATLGFDFSMAVLRCKNEDIKLAFWDIAGQERFTNLTRSYYQGATGGFVVLDITNAKSYEGAKRWKADIEAKVHLKDGTPIPVMLLANKSDKLKEGVAPAMDLDQFAKDNGFIGWLATSSFTNTNIKQAVTTLVLKIIEMTRPFDEPAANEQAERDASIRLTSTEPAKSESCCSK